MHDPSVPLGKLFGLLTKRYIGLVTKQLEHLEIERYFYAVQLLHQADSPLTQNELAAAMHVDKAMMVRIIDYLCEKKYLQREVNPNDRRCHWLTLTPRGKETAPEIAAAFRNANAICLSAFDDGARSPFVDQLQSMCTHLSSVDADDIALDYTTFRSK